MLQPVSIYNAAQQPRRAAGNVTMTGKRKRDTSVVSRAKTAEQEEDSTPATPTTPTDTSHDLFRKFFESQFEPLDVPGGKVSREDSDKGENEDEDEDEDDDEEDSKAGSDWEGLSGEDDGVEVVEHRESSLKDGLLDKKARKAFMNARPPVLELDAAQIKTKTTSKPTKPADDEQDQASDADNLKNDLALQRLLKESHLLESASELAPTGKNRHKALDLRMQNLGAKSSLYQQKMPSSHRRGIKAKVATKDEKRRREARENGIVLEKPTAKAKPSSTKKRERGVGGPSVGKFSGGTLNLSQRDINAITGSGRKKGRR